MDPTPVELVVIVASVRAGRLGPTVADWFLRAVSERSDFAVTTVDLMDLSLPSDLTESPDGESFAAAIGAADAVVVVTPEYNHGYPGPLKIALDSVKYEWRGKPIGFVSYGGMSGGLRAVEQLRQVAAELHMVSVRDSVGIHRARKAFDRAGNIDDSAVVDSASRMLDQLQWWAESTRSRRDANPYPGSSR